MVEIRSETPACLREKDEMNTRKDDGPAANDDDDDEIWGNIKYISFDLTNDEVHVINATDFKFLFAGKYRGADKCLARPGRKQATATKL